MLSYVASQFKKRGSRFGYATTLNNMAVVAIADGKYSEALRHLEDAKGILSDLGSIEAYQPLTNMGVLAALSGDWSTAKRKIQDARAMASTQLAMDRVMFDFNEEVLNILARDIQPRDAIEKLRLLSQLSAKTRDIRFIEIVAWFVASLETALSITPTIDYSKEFIENLLSRDEACLEVLFPMYAGGKKIMAPLILSPHWRY
jgi:hypothetical protein